METMTDIGNKLIAEFMGYPQPSVGSLSKE